MFINIFKVFQSHKIPLQVKKTKYKLTKNITKNLDPLKLSLAHLRVISINQLIQFTKWTDWKIISEQQLKCFYLSHKAIVRLAI